MEGFNPVEKLPWWTEAQKRLADEIDDFIDELMPRIDEAHWKEEFPWDAVEKIAQRGYFGAGVPREYGGMGLGATGSAIIVEALGRLGPVGSILVNTLLGGLHQLIHFGTEAQREKWLPRIVAGELGGIGISEPFAGSDVAAVDLTARREGDVYVLAGKKRFVTGAGVVRKYLVYARTSDSPEEIARYRHLTAFMCEKDLPGLTVEKLNDFPGAVGFYNGYLDFDEVAVPAGDRIGEENEGWRVSMVGLNFERIMSATHAIGSLRDVLKTVLWYQNRRIQFGAPIIDLQVNQFKIADIITKMKVSRVFNYYAAYVFDSGIESPVDASVAKLVSSDAVFQCVVEAIQLMGGDGATKFYPVSRALMRAKIGQIAAGTSEIMKYLIFSRSMRDLKDELRDFSRKWHRVVHEELKVPVRALAGTSKRRLASDEDLIRELAEDYRVNPGLYMLRDDLMDRFEVEDDELDGMLGSLEEGKLVKLHKDARGKVTHAKATYEGLRKMYPPEYYQWYPEWAIREKGLLL
jgi:alkylation response protein AidB-like acyl-CoA dehydrogenase